MRHILSKHHLRNSIGGTTGQRGSYLLQKMWWYIMKTFKKIDYFELSEIPRYNPGFDVPLPIKLQSAFGFLPLLSSWGGRGSTRYDFKCFNISFGFSALIAWPAFFMTTSCAFSPRCLQKKYTQWTHCDSNLKTFQNSRKGKWRGSTSGSTSPWSYPLSSCSMIHGSFYM